MPRETGVDLHVDYDPRTPGPHLRGVSSVFLPRSSPSSPPPVAAQPAQVEPIGVIEVVDVPEAFSIVNPDGFCMEIPFSDPEDGAGFVTWDCSGADNQLFTFDVGWSVLHSGKCLAVDNRGDEPYSEQLVQEWEPFAGEKLAEARVRAVRTF